MNGSGCQQPPLKRKWTEERPSNSSFRDISGRSSTSSNSHGNDGEEATPSANFSDSDSEEEKPFDRESLLRDIDADIKSIISNTSKGKQEWKEDVKIKKEEDILKTAAAVTSNYRGADGALYTLEIFMRDKRTCRTKKDRPGKSDPRAPMICDKVGVTNAIIPANHKLMLLCTRMATNPRQYIKRGSYVLFKFFVDGDALSEGTLHEASISKPDFHFAKAFIDTHEVRDTQRVEFAHEANAQVGTFVVEVYTKLKETVVSQQFSATPEDDRVLEKTKRRICCSAARDEAADVDVTSVDPGPGPSSSSLRAGGNKQITRFDTPQPGLKESGRPAATIKISYDDVLGTRSRHYGDQLFSINNLRLAGVTEAMLREAYPGGVPDTAFSGTVDLTSDNEEEDIKTEIKEEGE